MSRRRSQPRDSVGDHVANRDATQDLDWCLRGIGRIEAAPLVWDVVAKLARDPSYELPIEVREHLGPRVRTDPQMRELLELQTITVDGQCAWCGRDLPVREPGTAGRLRKYCPKGGCRQKACRYRKQRADRPMIEPARRRRDRASHAAMQAELDELARQGWPLWSYESTHDEKGC